MRVLLPVWINRAISTYLVILSILLIFGFHFLAIFWYIFGASMVEDEEEAMEEEEDEVDEADMDLFDLIVQYDAEGRNEDPEENHRALVEVFDTHIMEPFFEPDYDCDESFDILCNVLKEIQQEELDEIEAVEIVEKRLKEKKASLV